MEGRNVNSQHPCSLTLNWDGLAVLLWWTLPFAAAAVALSLWTRLISGPTREPTNLSINVNPSHLPSIVPSPTIILTTTLAGPLSLRHLQHSSSRGFTSRLSLDSRQLCAPLPCGK